MVVLYFADIFGKPGRQAIRHALPDLIERYTPDFIIANVENLAGGRGVNRKTLSELTQMGFTIFTSGNHIWDNKEVYQIFETDDRLLRPANWLNPPGDPCPGKGFNIFKSNNGDLAVVNLMGRVFMEPMNCPFATIDQVLTEIPVHIPVFVDMHADATSEKYAMAWHLAGRVAAVVGSHSHVQTADERILPGGTAYITDVGMTGSFDSVIGLTPHEVIKRFKTKRPAHPTTARTNLGYGCVIIEIDEEKKAKSIERIRATVNLTVNPEDKDME